MSTCRSCGAPIKWVRANKYGAYMPLDAEPSPDGTVLVEDGKAVVIGSLERPLHEGELHVSHFATCPQASGWRR